LRHAVSQFPKLQLM